MRGCAGARWIPRAAKSLNELETERAELDALTAKIVAEGLATLATPASGSRGAEEKVLIVRGTSHLLESMEAQSDLDRIRTLFDDIERKNDLIRLLELAAEGDGVRIFIGSENRLFSLSGSSIVAAPLCQCARQDHGRDRRAWGPRASIMPASSRWSITPQKSLADCWADALKENHERRTRRTQTAPDRTMRALDEADIAARPKWPS